MKIFEGYKKAVEIYNNYTNTQDGRDYVTKLNAMGVSKEYMEWVTSNVIVFQIPLYLILNAYKDWKRYVVKFYKNNNSQVPNINRLKYNQVIKIINECKRKFAKPNPIYDKNGVYVGVLSTYEMANMLPINTTWCITKTPKRYEQFNNESQKCLYITNSKNSDPYRRVIAVCSGDNIEYWDSTNHRMEEEEIEYFEKSIPIEVENIIHKFAYQMGDNNKQELNCNTNMNKKLIRLTESDLHRIVKESVNRVLNEIGNTPKGQYMLGKLTARQNGNNDRRSLNTSHYAFGKRVDAAQDELNSTNDTQKLADSFNDLTDAYNSGAGNYDDRIAQDYYKKRKVGIIKQPSTQP